MATHNWMNLGVPGLGDELKRVPRMPRLSATGLAAGSSQTAWLGFLEPVAGGRLATVLAILGELIFQCLNPRLQRANDCDQSVDITEDGFFALSVSSAHLFICG